MGRKSSYRSKEKKYCVNKQSCNKWLANNSRGYRRAMILDTEQFVTTKALLGAGVRKVVCPQMDGDVLRSMKRRLRDYRRRSAGFDGVELVDSTLAELLDASGSALMKNNLLVWVDAEGTWDCPVKTGTSVHTDVKNLIRRFADSSATRLMLAITVSSRSCDNQMELGTTETLLYRDIDAAVERCGVYKTIRAGAKYPGMCFVVVELKRTRTPDWTVGDKVSVRWKGEYGRWGSGLYRGVVEAIDSETATVGYPGNQYEYHPVEALLSPTQ